MSWYLPEKLSHDRSLQVVDETLAWILSLARPTQIIVFGSGARGEMSSQSDIDLIILGTNATDLNQLRKKVFGAKRPSAWPLDLFFYKV
jgi:predicted nucleotidyltransferase